MRQSVWLRSILGILVGVGALLLAACGPAGGPPGPQAGAPTATVPDTATAGASGSDTGTVSLSALPLGDGHISMSPQVGYVYSCVTHFGGGGAFTNGPWLRQTTWDSTAKIAVRGAIRWPQASYAARVEGSQRVITSDDLPVGYTTGVFPIQPSDPAYAYDRNPNSIAVKSERIMLTANPTRAASPSCVNMGMIGVLSDGVTLYNALDGEGRDAVAHEVLDICGGHPDMSGEYHHHDVPPCLLKTATGTSTLVGYALDGFGVYVERDASGRLLTNASLDACHGRTSDVLWDGKSVSMYHYDATAEYPYTVGCYMGTPVSVPHP